LLTLVKLAGLGVIIYFGFSTTHPVAFTEGKASPEADFGVGLLLVMYAFGGWNDMAFVASELRNKRNIVRALIAGVVLITGLYLAVNAAYILALGWDGAHSYDPPLPSAILSKALGDFAGRGMAVIVMVSALGAINGLIFTGSRVYASLGKDWGLFAFLGRWNKTFGSPSWALLLQGAIAISMILAVGTETGRKTIDHSLTWVGDRFHDTMGIGHTEDVADEKNPDGPPIILRFGMLGPLPWERYFGGFNTLFAATAPVFWIFFLATGLSLFKLRERDRDMRRPFSVPLFPLVPYIFCLACTYFFYRALTYAGMLSLIGWIPLAIGIPLYWLSKRTTAEEPVSGVPGVPPPPSSVPEPLPPAPVSEPPHLESAPLDHPPHPEEAPVGGHEEHVASFRFEDQPPPPPEEKPANQPPPP
jgi:amino acid transporter